MQTADARYAVCMDRLQPFLHSTLTGGHSWKQSNVTRAMVEKRMEPVRQFLPGAWDWVQKNIENAVARGLLVP